MIAVLLDATKGSEGKLERKLKEQGWGLCRLAGTGMKSDPALVVDTVTAAFRDERLSPKTVLVHDLEGLSPSYILRLVRALRRSIMRPPIAILSPPLETQESKRIIAAVLRAGADDFVIGSATAAELALRLDAIIHRWRRRRAASRHRVGDLAIRRDSRLLQCGSNCVTLTVSEYKLFELLMRRVGQPVRREQLLQQRGSHRAPTTSNMAEVYIL